MKFAAYKNEVPDEFKTLLTDKRIMAPCKLSFNEGAQYSHYFDNYINEFWEKYSKEDLVFRCDAGTFYGRVHGDAMIFTSDGSTETYTIYKGKVILIVVILENLLLRLNYVQLSIEVLLLNL